MHDIYLDSDEALSYHCKSDQSMQNEFRQKKNPPGFFFFIFFIFIFFSCPSSVHVNCVDDSGIVINRIRALEEDFPTALNRSQYLFLICEANVRYSSYK
jgi:hypothetical protein